MCGGEFIVSSLPELSLILQKSYTILSKLNDLSTMIVDIRFETDKPIELEKKYRNAALQFTED